MGVPRHGEHTGKCANVVAYAALLQACFEDRVAALRLEALLFLRMALDCCPPATFRANFAELTPAVISCADDDWYDD